MQNTRTKELLLLRHGKSDWNTLSTDFYRPLKKRGKRDALRIGQWLLKQQLIPDLILSSPAVRALKTAELVCKALHIADDSIQIEQTIYEASLANLRDQLLDIPDCIQRLLLIGHNPGLEQLLYQLIQNISIPDDGKLMPTATLAYLQMDSHWSGLAGRYFIQRPKDLSE